MQKRTTVKLTTRFAAFFCATALGGSIGAQDNGARTDPAKLHRDLTAAKEAWQAIPWHLSLLEARAQAAKENKPVYMLCRAGHPLGCV
jgi:hypothetical protein